jgi:O-antigen/teichoic acid export membrane protein
LKNIKNFLTTKTFRTTFSLLVNMVGTGIIGLVFWRIAATVFPEASQIGVAGTLISVTHIASILAASGLLPAITLMFSNKGGGNYFADHIIGFKTVSSILAVLMALLISLSLMFIPNFEFLQNPLIVFIVVLLSGSMASGMVLDYSMIATGQSRYVPYRNILISALKTLFLGGIIFIASSAGQGILVATLIAQIIGNSIYTFKGTGKNFTGWQQTMEVTKTLKENLFSHQVSSLTASLPPVLAPIIITGVLSTSESGLFTIAWLLAGLLFYAATAVSNAFLADAANLHYRIVKIQIHKAIIFGMLLIIAGIIGFIGLGHLFLNFFGDNYTQAYFLLILLSASSLPNFFKNILIAYARSRSLFKIPILINSISGVATVVALLILPAMFSLDSVGWIWLVIMSLGALGTWAMVRYYERSLT